MNSQPKVSVIMPSLNVAPYIRECIESVVNQTLREIEIICVDAGSTDGTLEVLEEYAAKDGRIKLLHSDKKSYGYQMNLGIDAATGEYMGIVETDDYALPEMYEELYALAKENDVDICKGDFCRFYGDGKERRFEYAKISKNGLYGRRISNAVEHPEVLRCYLLNQPGIYRRAFLEEKEIRLNETPGASHQDNGLWFQMFTQAEGIYLTNKAYYMLRRDNPNSSVYNIKNIFVFCDEYDFIRDNLKKNSFLEKNFANHCAYYRLCNYDFALNRIAPEYKLAFVRKYADDFRKIQADGELDEALYSKGQFLKLTKIMDNPDLYYYQEIYPTQICKKGGTHAPKSEADFIRESVSYKIGRAITFVPRKVRGLFRCIREHGYRYPFKRILEHLHITPNMGGVNQDNKTNPVKGYSYYSNLRPKDYPKELALWYKQKTGKELNLKNPKTFDEKIQWMKLYDVTPLKTMLADKYACREWVTERIGDEYLVPLLGVWDSFDEIDFDTLPDKFVLKANHGCHWNVIVKDKKSLDLQETKKKFDKWMNTNYAFVYGLELQYMNIRPKIIAEAYLENNDQGLNDYKVLCFNGKAESILFISERENGAKKAFFDLDWNRLPIWSDFPGIEKEVEKPKNLELIIELAEKLSKGFPQVRVDFYVLNDGSIKFGEMTFTWSSGIHKWGSEQDIIYGNMVNLPAKKKIPTRKTL